MIINETQYYTIQNIATLLEISPARVRERCNSWEIKYTNVWTETRQIYRIKGANLTDYLER